MFVKRDSREYETALPGIGRRTLSYGDRTVMTEFRLAAGSVLPMHAHPHEQTGFLVAGHLRLTIGDDRQDVLPGDSWCIPGDVVHGAEVIEDAVAVEVFSPLREEYLPAEAGR